MLLRKLITKNQLYNIRKFTNASKIDDVIVIGGGPAGYVAAIKGAQLGMNVTCVEGRGTLGGTCLNVGCIPSKALLHSSHLFHSAKHDFSKYGITHENLSINISKMMASKTKNVKSLTGGIEMLFKKNKVKYVKGQGKLTGNNQITVKTPEGKNKILEAKKIVIATGSTVAQLPGINIDEQNIVSSTGALEFKEVPKKLVVIGAGVIGLELGSVQARLGSEVTVVEYLDRIVPGLDFEIARDFQKILQKQGLKFKLGKRVMKAEEHSNQIDLLVADAKNAEKTETVSGDKVLVSIGRIPFTDGLGLENIGIEMDGKRIKTDDLQRTNKENIYAIGDVVAGPQLAHKAEEEGIAVMESIAGSHSEVNYNTIPGVVYTYPEVAQVGKTEEELKKLEVDYVVGKFPFLANSRAKTVDDYDGYVKIISNKKTDEVLGIHIMGADAGELIHEGCIAMEYGASSEDIARTCHAHPTRSEAVKEAAMAAHSKPIHF